jgi:hypothetical protein
MSSRPTDRGAGNNPRSNGVRWLADEPLRLLPLYNEPVRPLKRPAWLEDTHSPIVILRTGANDASHVEEALSVMQGAAAVVANLTERESTLKAVQKIATRGGLSFIGDPVLHRMALANYQAKRGARGLIYRPPDGGGPWTASDLRTRAGEIARRVIDEQSKAEGNPLLGAAPALVTPSDPMLGAVGPLLARSLLARNAWGQGAPLFAPVIVSIANFSDEAARNRFLSALGNAKPDGWLLLLDGVEMTSETERLLAAGDLIEALRERGGRVIVGRTGPLRRLWLTIADGVEVALGRLERFRLSEQSGSGGGGQVPPRWECPDLLCSVPQPIAGKLLATGLLEECCCPACRDSTIPQRLQRSTVHNAWVIQADYEMARAAGREERAARLSERLRHARSLTFDLEEAGVCPRKLGHLESWEPALAEWRQRGLLAEEAA